VRPSTFGGKWSSPGNHHTTFKVQPVPPRLVHTLCWVCVFKTEQWSGDVGTGKRLSIVHQRLFFLNGKPEAAEPSDAEKYRTIIAIRASQSTNRKSAWKGRMQAALRFRCTLSPHAMESPAERSGPRNIAVTGLRAYRFSARLNSTLPDLVTPGACAHCSGAHSERVRKNDKA
jgi:hypothetical protein